MPGRQRRENRDREATAGGDREHDDRPGTPVVERPAPSGPPRRRRPGRRQEESYALRPRGADRDGVADDVVAGERRYPRGGLR